MTTHLRGVLLSALLALAASAGCASSPPARASNWLERLAAARAALATDGVLLDVVLLERPMPDSFLNEELWKRTDEHIVAGEEQQAALERSGFRVGQVIGLPPERLQSMLASERWCVSRWRQILPAGKPLALALARDPTTMRYQISEGGQPDEVELPQAQPFLVAVPTLAAENCTTLRFTPQVQYGAETADFRAAPDRSGWQLSYRRPHKTYDRLSWEVTLAPNEYIVIGCTLDPPERLGPACLTGETGGRAVQRLLVVRTTRAADDAAEERPEGAAPTAASRAAWATQ
jgi:hypothetical protein